MAEVIVETVRVEIVAARVGVVNFHALSLDDKAGVQVLDLKPEK